MKVLKVMLLAAGISAAAASSAVAATVYASLVDYNPVGTIASDRKNPANALGPTDGKFLSLGLGGSAVFSFGTSFTGPATILEVTYGNRSGYVETANVYGGTSYDPDTNSLLGFTLLTAININNSVGSISVPFAAIYKFLAIVDTSSGAGRDGFDIDSVSVSAVPLPAGLALLGSGITLLGFVGRRRNRTAVAA